MFGFLRKKTEKEVLQQRYEKLMADAHKHSQSNRKLSDAEYLDAEKAMQQLESLMQY